MNRAEFRIAYRNARSLFRLGERFGVLPDAFYSVPKPAFYAANTSKRHDRRTFDPLSLSIRACHSGPAGWRLDRVNGGLRA